MTPTERRIEKELADYLCEQGFLVERDDGEYVIMLPRHDADFYDEETGKVPKLIESKCFRKIRLRRIAERLASVSCPA